MFKRDLALIIDEYKKFPAIALLGPRQAGKTTLVKDLFPQHVFFTMDNESTRSFATEDPERFFAVNENQYGIILDEFQCVPKITSYIKQIVDVKNRPGYFVLTGSQNFLANAAITESLAGRVGILNLMPLSLHEMVQANLLENQSIDEIILHGGYPRLYNEKMTPSSLYPSYLQTYIERDVRQLINIGNLSTFQRFMQLCAGRNGNILNIDALSVECGVSFPTIRSWLSILEASYIIFLLQPHFNNYNKRLIKSPKLYFLDTGLACSLLRLETASAIAVSPFRGALFESLIITDLYKQYCNRGQRPPLYFWRDHGGAHEIDCILDEGTTQFPIEIKSGQTISQDFFKGVNYWNEVACADPENSFIVYGGSDKQLRSKGSVLGWKDAATLIDTVKQRLNSLQKAKAT